MQQLQRGCARAVQLCMQTQMHTQLLSITMHTHAQPPPPPTHTLAHLHPVGLAAAAQPLGPDLAERHAPVLAPAAAAAATTL